MLLHKNHLRDTGPDGRNAKINIPQTEYKREECIRPAPLHGPVTGSWQDGNEPSFSTKGVTVPNQLIDLTASSLGRWAFGRNISESTLNVGTAVAEWLRCCATNRKVAGSFPAGVVGFSVDIKYFRSHYGPGVDSASNRNEYQEHFLRVKAAGA